jgi:hypothetical protein
MGERFHFRRANSGWIHGLSASRDRSKRAPHVTQRGNGRRFILDCYTDRNVYLNLLWQSLALHSVAMTGYCLMSNHVHLVLVPIRTDSLGLALKHARMDVTPPTGTPSITQVGTFGKGGITLAPWTRRTSGRRCAIRNLTRCGLTWWPRPHPGCGPVQPSTALWSLTRGGWQRNCGSLDGIQTLGEHF